MSVQIIVPPLGESVKDAIIASICKKNGDYVGIDELIIELETDKVTLEISASVAGTIEQINVNVGDKVVIGQVLGSILEGSTTQKSNVAQNETTQQPIQQLKKETSNGNMQLSPSVQRIVTESNINPIDIIGSGRDGRITKYDAENAALNNIQKKSNRVERTERMSKLRQTVARRLKESQNTAAILTTFNEIDMSTVMNLRKEYQDIFVKKHGIKLGFMSFFLKACVIALKEIPNINARIQDDSIIYYDYCDIGVAVGTENGLVVPVIRNAEEKCITDLEKAVAEYGKKARDGKISLDDLNGGTFTISNGGVYGSLLSTPIINPPQSGILGLHNIQDRVIVVNGQIVVRPMMYVALSYDHRIVDGKEAVTFLIRIKELIEDPRRIVVNI